MIDELYGPTEGELAAAIRQYDPKRRTTWGVMLKLEQAAPILKISVDRMRRLLDENEIPHVGEGDSTEVSVFAIGQYLAGLYRSRRGNRYIKTARYLKQRAETLRR